MVGLKGREDLSQYLHDLGVFLHFQENKILREIIILEPEWGTKAVYRVLEDTIIKNNLGHFKQGDLHRVWSDPQYENMHNKLLALMMQFELCYEIPSWPFKSGRYVAPQLLSKNPPPYNWNTSGNLLLRYKSREFMPRGIVARFIVMMHEKIEEQKLVWRDGVVLRFDDARAEIVEYYNQREIRIRICGRNKRDALTIIDHELKKIYDSFHNLSYERLVPCICLECKKIRNHNDESYQQPHFFRFEILKKHRNNGRKHVPCDESSLDVDLQKLIDDSGIDLKVDEPKYDIRASKELREQIIRVFNQEEFTLLCHDQLEIDLALFLKNTFELKVLELINWAERRGRLHDLIEACRKKRPNADWPKRTSQ